MFLRRHDGGDSLVRHSFIYFLWRRLFIISVFLHRPLSFSFLPLSCTVIGDCLSNLVVLHRCGLFFSKPVGEYQFVIQAISLDKGIVSCLNPMYSHLVNYNHKIHLPVRPPFQPHRASEIFWLCERCCLYHHPVSDVLAFRLYASSGRKDIVRQIKHYP